MNRISILAILGIAGLAASSPAPAHAEDGLTLEPSSDWRLREYEDRCRVSRSFGEGEDRTTLWIEQGGQEPNYNVTLIGRPLRHPYGGGVHIQFGEQPEAIRSYISAESSRGRPVLMMYGVMLAPLDPELERGEDIAPTDLAFDHELAESIETLRMRTSIVEPLRLELGPMGEPLAFLNQCGLKISALLSEAGRALTGEATPPIPIESARDWIRDGDYPNYLIAAQMQGRLTVRLTVNAAGRPSSCFVTQSNKPQLFDDAVCLNLMKRAEFEPARNAAGEPVASYYFTNVTFRMR
ncbi:TonB family protein [uncultured Erythrobacter sp.]|uniref:energy transducer TonB n=1 Tax=uncultured Erythrobacter sp. TaxID=263913 RepID=UPI002610CC55|nr:TonB family protein [uncultured Erythrobacter sp.]